MFSLIQSKNSFFLSKQIPHNFLGDITELIIILAGKTGYGLFRQIAELITF